MSDFLGELASKMHELGLRGIPLEVVIAGSSTYEIDGAGTKWAPLKLERPNTTRCFRNHPSQT